MCGGGIEESCYADVDDDGYRNDRFALAAVVDRSQLPATSVSLTTPTTAALAAGWTEIGAGYCFPTSAHEKKYRIGSWRRGALNVAKSSCERIKDCVGVHVHTKDKKFVLLSKTGAPGGQDIGDRECHTYARPPIGIELDCQPRGALLMSL